MMTSALRRSRPRLWFVMIAVGAATTSVTHDVQAAMTTQPAPAHGPSWTGVRQVVTADVGPDGSISGTPTQQTAVSATSKGTARVGVPMSSSGLRTVGSGKAPPVIDGVAHFTLDPEGTATETVQSDFTTPLPLTVTPAYELDGQPTTPRS